MSDKSSDAPGDSKPYRPKHLAGFTPIAVVIFMVALAGGLEGILAASKKHNGFPISGKISDLDSELAKAFPTITDAQIVNKFLSSFLPPLVFVPLVFFLAASCQSIKVVQPFINLGKGPSRARDSILLDYVDQNPVQVIWSSMRRKNLMVSAAGVVILLSLLYQPLAGSLFQIRTLSVSTATSGLTTGLLESNPQSVARPTVFLAAAGFDSTDMVSTGLLPPFVTRGDNSGTDRWVVPPFQLREPSTPGDTYLAIESKALYIQGSCAPARNVKLSNNNGNVTITGSLSDTCSSTLSVTASGTTWLGAAQSADPSCVTAINSTWGTLPSGTNSSWWPVVFGFSQGGTEGSMAFCMAYQQVYDATAWSYVPKLSLYEIANAKPVQDSLLNGYVLNGVDLKGLQIPDTGGDLTTEDTIIGYLLADSVIRGAGIVSNGLEVNVTSQNTRLSGDISADCLNSYLNYLATLSLRIYVNPPGSTGTVVPARLWKDVDRIYVYAPSAHTLTALLLLTALLMGIASWGNHQQRKQYLRVRNAPGCIGSAAVLLSHASAFGDVGTTDSLETIEQKLGDRVFRINPQTWAIEESPAFEHPHAEAAA